MARWHLQKTPVPWLLLTLPLVVSLAHAAEPQGLGALLSLIRTSTNVSTAAELLEALNQAAGSSQAQLITLQDDVFIRPEDMQPFQPALPINGGNRTLVLRGGKPGSNLTVLDWGGTVGVMHHPAGHTFVAYGLALRGMAPPSSGIAAGLKEQVVNAFMWPTFTIAPGHLMAFWNSSLTWVSPSCGPNSTAFLADALQRSAAGTNTSIQALDSQTIYVGQRLNGSLAVRNATDGDLALGNVRWLWENITIKCTLPPRTKRTKQAAVDSYMTTADGDSGSAAAAAAAASARERPLGKLQTASTGIAGTAADLMLLLSSPTIERIVMTVPICLTNASWQAYALPIHLRQRSLVIQSDGDGLKMLDFGGHPALLHLSANSSLTFRSIHLRGAAPPSAALSSRSTTIAGSPLWPTVDGEPGHRMAYEGCTVHAIVTPCSQKSTEIAVGLLAKVLGPEGVRMVGNTSYIIQPRYARREPITDTTNGEEVGIASYTFDHVLMECEEDASISLAAELAAGWDNRTGTPGPVATAAAGRLSPWLVAVISTTAAVCAVLALGAGLLLWQGKRTAGAGSSGAGSTGAERTPSGSAKLAPADSGELEEAVPVTPRAASLDCMELGQAELEMDAELDAAATSAQLSRQQRPPEPAYRQLQMAGSHAVGVACAQSTLRSIRFGVIEGLEIGDLLGRGGFGKVYEGLWFGGMVAVKVVEHCVPAGKGDKVSHQPLLCMSVSHPNCITTYKLSVIRLLHGEDLLDEGSDVASEGEEAGSEEEHSELDTHFASSPVPPASMPTKSSASGTTSDVSSRCGGSSIPGADADVSTVANGSSGARVGASAGSCRGRRVRSLLSGAEGVEVEDPYGPLLPRLYETWMVSEYCDRRTLGDALAQKALTQPDGKPNMVHVYLCLLEVASGMQYLHSLGIMHGNLKPANVLLKGAPTNLRGYTCKLADFGLSRMVDGHATHVKSGSHGAPTHAAPELLLEGRLSPAADVFAFGVLAWELVAGEQAYCGQHPMHIILQVTQHGARPPPPPHCPPALTALMQRCWQEDPAARPTLAALLPELEHQLLAATLVLAQQPSRSSSAAASASIDHLSIGDSSSTTTPPLPQAAVPLA